MKHRKGASQRVSDEGPVTFIDVVSCFSEEEWKLLHHWQKELYRNVMKDIQLALLSLGPMIANSVFSLKPKGHEELYDMDIEDTKLSHDLNTFRGDLTGDSNAVLRKTSIAKQHLKDSSATLERGRSDMPSTDIATIDSFSIKKESDVETLDYANPQETDRPTETTRPEVTRQAASGSVADKEESYALETQDCGGGEGVSSSPEPGAAVPYIPMGINEEGETYPIDIQDYGKSGGISSYVGDEAAGAEKNLPPKVSSEKINMFLSSYKDPGSRSYVWPESNWSERGVKSVKCQSDIDNQTHSTLHHRRPNTGHEGDLSSVQVFAGQSELENSRRPCTVPESDEDLKQHIRFLEPHRSNTSGSRKVNYHCKVCGKGFRQKCSLICHERVHSGEKPYHCSVCDKRFTQKHRLIGHQRTHSGEKPFQCDVCLKSFTWKDGLLKHYRTHTGERPYQCTKCMKCFTQKEGVIRHLKTHSSQKHQLVPFKMPL